MMYNTISLVNFSESGTPDLFEPVISPFPGPQTTNEYIDDFLVSPIQYPYSTAPTIYTGIGTTLMNAPGWWTCHECKNMNSPHLAPERCSVCSHPKCAECPNNVAPPAP